MAEQEKNLVNPLLVGDSAYLTALIVELMPKEPDFMYLSQAATLSRKKAKKLANRYRGSRRGQRYVDYLNGKRDGYVVRHNRLHVLPRLGKTQWTCVHSESAAKALANEFGKQGVGYHVEGPVEVGLS